MGAFLVDDANLERVFIVDFDLIKIVAHEKQIAVHLQNVIEERMNTLLTWTDLIPMFGALPLAWSEVVSKRILARAKEKDKPLCTRQVLHSWISFMFDEWDTLRLEVYDRCHQPISLCPMGRN